MKIRRLYTVVDEALHDMEQDREEPLRKVAVVAVISNPHAGKGYVEDLSDLTDSSIELGSKIATMGAEQMAPYTVDSYGKAALIGTAGEQEHGVACLTTVYATLRDAVGGGKAWISSITKRARPGEQVDIPLAHKDALFVRSHYDGMTIMLLTLRWKMRFVSSAVSLIGGGSITASAGPARTRSSAKTD